MLALINHIFDKPAGDIKQEIGQVGVSLLALAEFLKISADDEELVEVNRITALSKQHFIDRQTAKFNAGVGLPPFQNLRDNS